MQALIATLRTGLLSQKQQEVLQKLKKKFKAGSEKKSNFYFKRIILVEYEKWLSVE